MTYYAVENRLGLQPIANIDTNQNHALGTVVRAQDPTYGVGEFVYLKGVASTVVGNSVIWDPVAGTTTLTPSTANLARPIAIAMSACTASYYGWYQIEGAAVIKKVAIAVNPNVAIYQSLTAGRVSSTASNGKQILGARTINTASVASATSTITVLINRPHMQGATT